MSKITITSTKNETSIKTEGVSSIELIGLLTFYRDKAIIDQLHQSIGQDKNTNKT